MPTERAGPPAALAPASREPAPLPARARPEPGTPATIMGASVATPSRPTAAGIVEAPLYAGFVTRAVALAVDVAIVTGVAFAIGVVVALGVSALHLPEQANELIATVLGGFGLLWSAAYFVFFWSSTGQTPGDRLMAIAVLDSAGRGSLKPRRAALRFCGLWLALIPLGAGALIMFWDRRSRCLQDRLARTIVVHVADGA